MSTYQPMSEDDFEGMRKYCTDNKRCGLGAICEHAQNRGQAVECKSMWGHTHSECPNYIPRKELCSENDVFRSKRPKHNAHAGPRKEPDLMVKRHIRNGENINDGD